MVFFNAEEVIGLEAVCTHKGEGSHDAYMDRVYIVQANACVKKQY